MTKFCADCGCKKKSHRGIYCKVCGYKHRHCVGFTEKHSDSTRAKISRKNKGRKLSPETRARIGAASLGRKHGPETRAKISKARLRVSLSDEHREALSRAKRGKPQTPAMERQLDDARSHRTAHDTTIERYIRELLWEIGETFYQQHRFEGMSGSVDFYLPVHRVAIECDGKYWHSQPGVPERDARKNTALAERNIHLLRLPEDEINNEWDAVASRVTTALACQVNKKEGLIGIATYSVPDQSATIK